MSGFDIKEVVMYKAGDGVLYDTKLEAEKANVRKALSLHFTGSPEIRDYIADFVHVFSEIDLARREQVLAELGQLNDTILRESGNE